MLYDWHKLVWWKADGRHEQWHANKASAWSFWKSLKYSKDVLAVDFPEAG